jgi:hypothetical protein
MLLGLSSGLTRILRLTVRVSLSCLLQDLGGPASIELPCRVAECRLSFHCLCDRGWATQETNPKPNSRDHPYLTLTHSMCDRGHARDCIHRLPVPLVRDEIPFFLLALLSLHRSL